MISKYIPSIRAGTIIVKRRRPNQGFTPGSNVHILGFSIGHAVNPDTSNLTEAVSKVGIEPCLSSVALDDTPSAFVSLTYELLQATILLSIVHNFCK